MTTVAEMIKYLQTLPQDAEVECGVEHTVGYETCMIMTAVDLNSCYVQDYTDEIYSRTSKAGKIVVQINGY